MLPLPMHGLSPGPQAASGLPHAHHQRAEAGHHQRRCLHLPGQTLQLSPEAPPLLPGPAQRLAVESQAPAGQDAAPEDGGPGPAGAPRCGDPGCAGQAAARTAADQPCHREQPSGPQSLPLPGHHVPTAPGVRWGSGGLPEGAGHGDRGPGGHGAAGTAPAVADLQRLCRALLQAGRLPGGRAAAEQGPPGRAAGERTLHQPRRQFQKAENHFSTAIRHNPQKAQYYLYRAKSRQLLQNIFGARQDVATVLLLNPKQPKLSLLMTNLFPGMSVEEVLSTQIAHLARLQLEQMVEGSLQAGSPQGIVGMLKRHELERQKALALQHSWKQGEPLIATSEELKATPEIPQVKPGSSEGEAEAPEEEEEKEKEKKEEKKSELIPSKVASLSDSYLDQTSSASSMSFRTTGTSETEMSAICQEYRSTSATAVTFSDSSLLKTQSSDSGNNREALSHGPRKIKATQGQRQSLSKTEPTQSQRRNSSKTKATIHKRNSSKTKATQSQRRNSSKTRATQGQGQSSSKTEATQGQRQSSSEIEATQGPRQEPSKTKTTRSPRQRPRKVKAARGRSWRPSKVDATQGRSRGLLRSSTKTEAFYDSNWSLSKTEYAQGQGQRSSKAEGAQGKSQGMSSTSSKAESTWGPSPSLSKTEVDQDLTYYEAV
ncbi:tetratricopeptide repeat protein 16 isoform X8 [Homo sapiens]|uniref:tetratricopeptide repeat protein 16 isoform X8 n=1 Tax=Homo sapiens TaxID=9606 RepID=UPI000387BCC6|nr:tetratricopeptide repeat protein 16 isoform X8 [Homo sapiens]|eukprot:XP_005251791.1 tetratricopeptide repeat protein 16 isoform X8 [Homo sapiens]